MKKNKKIKKQEKKLQKKQAKLEKKSAKLQKKLNGLQPKVEDTQKTFEKNKKLIRIANNSGTTNSVKSITPKKKSLHLKDLGKNQKKAQKNLNKIRKVVKKTFFPTSKSSDTETVAMINALTNSIRINRVMMAKDKKNQKEWEERYTNDLFKEFMQFINKYNKGYAFKVDELQSKVDLKQRQLGQLTTEVKTLEKRKAELEKIVAE